MRREQQTRQNSRAADCAGTGPGRGLDERWPVNGVVPGATIDEAAVRLAGALAELSEVKIEVRSGGGLRVVDARKTDLPGVVRACAAAGGGTLACLGLGVRITVSREGLEWRADDAETARRFVLALEA